MAVETQASLELLFLLSRKFESEKAIRGAILLTDTDTKPIEFRCTNSVRPSSLQTVLYGQMLQRHILIELIGVPLMNSLRRPPSVVVVQDAESIWLRSRIASPVVQLTKESDIPTHVNGDGGRTVLLSSNSGKFDPIVLVAHKDFATDIEAAAPILSQVFNRFDLMEPFQRIFTALEQVHQQKVGEDK